MKASFVVRAGKALCACMLAAAVPVLFAFAFAVQGAYAGEGDASLVAADASPSAADDLAAAALKDGSGLETSFSDDAAWRAVEDEEGRVYVEAAAESDGAQMSVALPGAGWLLWDWRLGNFDQQNWPKAAIKVSTTSGDNLYPYGDLESNNSANARWQTAIVKIAAAASVTWTWQACGANAACIDNVRFVTDKVAVSALTDAHTNASVTAGGVAVDEVDPGTTVVFSAAGTEGYAFAGWKHRADDEAPCTTEGSFSERVFDEPLSYYAFSEKPFQGEGTEQAPFLLASFEDLQKLARYVGNGTSFAGRHFALAGDIDAQGRQFQGIGVSSTRSFGGTLDGAGHAIRDIKLANGLFNYAIGAVIQNLDIRDAQLSFDKKLGDGGGIAAGRFKGVMRAVSTSGTVGTATGFSSSACGLGGVVGYLESESSLEECSSSARLVPTKHYIGNLDPNVGGIVGVVGSYDSALRACLFTGSIDAGTSDETISNVGGIAGRVTGTGARVSGCMSACAIQGAYNRAGGIVGHLDSASALVENCEFAGSIEGATRVGGIVGGGCGTVRACLSTGSVAASAAGGIAGGIAGDGVTGATTSATMALKGNVALVQSVSAALGGRIGGMTDPSGASANYGYHGMLVGLPDEWAVVEAQPGADHANGTTVDGRALRSAEGLPAAYGAFEASSAWLVSAAAKPQLNTSVDIASLSTAALPAYVSEFDEEGEVVVPEPADLAQAVKQGSDLALSSLDRSQWRECARGEGMTCIATSEDLASVDMEIDSDVDGWLLFDWAYLTPGTYLDAFTVTVEGDHQALATETLRANDGKAGQWATVVMPVAAGSTDVEWKYVRGAGTTVMLDEVRFVTEKTAVTVSADGHTAAAARVAGRPVTEVEPGTKVEYEAGGADGFVFGGWKASADAQDAYRSEPTFTQVVYDEPVSMYAFSARPFRGSGTRTDPFQLASRADLELLHSFVAAGTAFEGRSFALVSDIDCASAPFTTIGYVNDYARSSFAGSLDGRGHTVTFKSSTGGLFAALAEGSEIGNLNLDVDIDARGASALVGGLAGSCSGSVNAITVTGSLYAEHPSQPGSIGFGGVVGELAGGAQASDCICEAKVGSDGGEYQATGPNLGGIAGKAGYNVSIRRCAQLGAVAGGQGSSRVGGIVGLASSGGSSILECYVSGAVDGAYDVGGIVGVVDASGSSGWRIAACEVAGPVSGSSRVGGIVGNARLGSTGDAMGDGIVECLVSGAVAAGEGPAAGVAGFMSGGGWCGSNLVLANAVDGADTTRIAQKSSTSTVRLSGNYALEGLLLNGAALAAGDPSATGEDVQGASIAPLVLRGLAPCAPAKDWDASSWQVAPGKKPLLAATPALAAVSGDALPLHVVARVAAPRANGPFDYDGNSKTGVDEGLGYGLSGTSSAVAAGDYAVSAKPLEGFEWDDGSTDALQLNWTIRSNDLYVADRARAAEAARAIDAAAASLTPDKALVTAARAAYDALTPAQRALLGSEALGRLLDAEEALAKLPVAKKANPLTVKAKAIKAKAKKKTTFKAKKAFKVKGVGAISYKKKSGTKKITVAANGKVTVKKGLKRGKTYKVKVRVRAAGNARYKAAAKTVVLKVKIR